MTREEYLAKRRAYYQKNKHKWAEYVKAHRKEINKYWRKKRAENPERYRKKAADWRKVHKEETSQYNKRYHHSEKGQKRYKEYYENNKEAFMERAKKSNAKHPAERRAQGILNRAKAKGIISPRACEVCGKLKAEAHHDDYNKPLDVRWLCRQCHAEWHSKHEPIRVSEKVWCLGKGIIKEDD